jgi:flavorubredoxin
MIKRKIEEENMAARVTEIAENVYQISTYVERANFRFNQFLVLDEQPLLYHSGTNSLFPEVCEAVATLLDPSLIRWIGFSHFEADECGALAAWQSLAPEATAVCGLTSKVVSVDDAAALRPAQALADGETFSTGKYRFRFLRTPHVPHAWDAGHLFEETQGILFCSDLFHQEGDLEPLTNADVVGLSRQTLLAYQSGPMSGYFPYTNHTQATLERLAGLNPFLLAAMHGSAFVGDGAQALRDLAMVMKEVLAT